MPIKSKQFLSWSNHGYETMMMILPSMAENCINEEKAVMVDQVTLDFHTLWLDATPIE